MKHNRYIVPMLIAAAFAGTPAVAGINYLSQDRRVHAFASLAGSTDGPYEMTALDFNPFSASWGAHREEETDGDFHDEAGSFASQNSTLGSVGISYSGFVSAYVNATEFQDGAQASATSSFSVEFEVTEPLAFSFTGVLGLGQDVLVAEGSRIARTRILDSPYIYLTGGDINQVLDGFGELSFSGVLEPGTTYFLAANLEAFGGQSRQGSLSLEATPAAVPEAGTTAAGIALAGLAVWQWRRRRA